MIPGTGLLKRHVRAHKSEPLVEAVELLEANPQYAHVSLPDGRETTVSIQHLAPQGEVTPTLEEVTSTLENPSVLTPSSPEGTEVMPKPVSEIGTEALTNTPILDDSSTSSTPSRAEPPPLRRSNRSQQPPDRLIL